MNKRIVVTGEAKITSLLRDYITTKMEADFCCIKGAPLSAAQQAWIKSADYIILMHEIGQCDAEKAKDNMLLTAKIIESLPVFMSKATIASFVPRRSGACDDEVRAIKIQSEKLIQDYSNSRNTKAVLYRMPEIFGVGFNNEVIDRLIHDRKTETPGASHEFIHIDDLFYELYRMVNDAPAYVGHDSFAYPQGTFFSTESRLVKIILEFASLKAWEIPDFPSPFERYLYDYYLQKAKIAPSCKIKGDTVLSSRRFGVMTVTKLNPGEECRIDLHGASGVRLLLICGSIKIVNKAKYCADSSMIRINLTKNTVVKNIGDSIAVMEIWSHTIS